MSNPYVLILGITQDGGYPQTNCYKKCCKQAWDNTSLVKYTCSIAIVDPKSKTQWIIDATPDIKFQLKLLQSQTLNNQINGVFLTHAHIGHYSGLMFFGKEVINTKNLPVYTMKKMHSFISKNAPWKQLVDIRNINLKLLIENQPVKLDKRIQITPLIVPHRNEYSETVCYKIQTKNKCLLFMPDIDKLEKNIIDIIEEVDYAFIDGTFYNSKEIKRDTNEIPHPFVSESITLFNSMSKKNKQKIHFIHLNHTNPLLNKDSKEYKQLIKLDFKIAEQGKKFFL